MADEDFLRRWSRRKAQSTVAPAGLASQPLPAEARPPAPVLPQAEAPAAHTPHGNAAPAAGDLPDVAALEPGADISAFMARGVDEALRRRALKTLFQDPRFNVMDGLDIYIDDYSIPDPMPPEWLDKLEQLSHLGDRGARDREAAAQAAAEGEAAAAAEAGADAPGDAAPEALTDTPADAPPDAAEVPVPVDEPSASTLSPPPTPPS